MKYLLTLAIVLFTCSSLQARFFSYGLFVHRVDNQVKVEIYTDFPADDRANLTIPEAIAFLQTAPYSKGTSQVGIVAEGCSTADYAPLLKALIDGLPHAELAYFGGFASNGFKSFIEERRKKDGGHNANVEH